MLQNIPGYQAGTYEIDPVHSSVSFSIRHMMVSKVRGDVEGLEGTITLAEDPTQSSITATVDPSTINTRNSDRDAHLRSGEILSSDEFPRWSFTSTGARSEGDDLYIDGDLELRGVTKNVALRVEFGGIGQDAFGATRAGASASTRIKRSDFGITYNPTIETGGVVISDEVDLVLEISAVLQQEAAA